MFDRLKGASSGVVARRRGCAGLLGAAGTIALAPMLAHAADDATAGGRAVDGVTVTAAAEADTVSLSKLPENVHDIPQSITVIDQQQLKAQGATSLTDALRNVPGITIGGAEGGQIGNNINLNGFTARTDIFLDGMRDRGQYYRDTFALEQVEVLMGPSSMLFGRGSTGGAINQVSKRPTLDPLQEVEALGTTNGLGRVTADINVPLADNAAARIAAMGQSGGVSTRRKTTVQDWGVAPSVSWGLGTPTRLTLSALVQHNRDRPDYGVPPLNGVPVKSGRDTVYGYSDDHTIQDVTAIQAELRHKFDNGLRLRNQVQYNSVRTDARETAGQTIGTVGPRGFTQLSPANVSGLPLDQLWVRLQSHDRLINDTSLYDQLEASGGFTTGPFHHDLLAGVEVGHDTYRNQNFQRTGSCNGVKLTAGFTGCVTVLEPAYTSTPTDVEAPTNLAKGTATTTAFYVNDAIALNSQLKVIAGLRWDRFAARVSNSINSSNTAGNTTLAAADQTVNFTSVRTGLLWQPRPEQSWYFSYSTSFNPSLEQLTSTTGVTRALPPETNKSFEAGVKWDVLNERMDLTAAVFQITQDNSRSQNPDNTFTANGTIRVRGVRAGATGYVDPNWRFIAGYTHLDGEIVNAVAVGTLGMVPANTPGDSGSIWTTYDVTPNWQVGAGGVYVGKRYATNTNTVSAPGYFRTDATVAWHSGDVGLRLNVFNLFGKSYYDSLIQSDGGRIVPGSGRTAQLTLLVRR